MFENMSGRKRITILILAVVVLICLIAGMILFFTRLEDRLDAAPKDAGVALSRTDIGDANAQLSETGISDLPDDSNVITTLYYNGQEYVYNTKLSSLLILGIDDPKVESTGEVRNTSQSDVLILAVFNPDTESCTLIQFNRDTMCEIPVLDESGEFIGFTTEQLALAHTYGNGLEKSCENTVYAISRLLYGVSIDNYFSLTMDAIPILNDLVGGVTVTIEDNFEGIDDTLIRGETVTLTADNVEHFVRARHDMVEDPTNINRMARQRVYMTGLFQGMKEAAASSSTFVLDAYNAVSGSLVTDCTIDKLNDYANRFSNYSLSEIVTPEGEAVRGEVYIEFYMDEEALQQLVIDTFYLPVED